MPIRLLTASKRFAGSAMLLLSVLSACTDAVDESRSAVNAALQKIGKRHVDLAVPGVGAAYSDRGRFLAVESLMGDALLVPEFAASLSGQLDRHRVAGLLGAVMAGLSGDSAYLLKNPVERRSAVPQGMQSTDLISGIGDDHFKAALHSRPVLRRILQGLLEHGEHIRRSLAYLDERQRLKITLLAESLLANRAKTGTGRWLVNDELHALGADFPIDSLISEIRLLYAYIEEHLAALTAECQSLSGSEWSTAYGRIAIADATDNRHQGDFLLLIDTGGNDRYDNVAQPVDPGRVSLVIDVAGNDQVNWQRGAGPGSGILGSGIWIDRSGDDVYQGGNFGLGSGLFGAGIMIDYAGDDLYSAGSTSLGASYYGLGLMADLSGHDSYYAESNSQGYGGSGGIGLQVDYTGDDAYDCGHVLSDQGAKRLGRHKEPHYLSMCQGYGFGIRKKYSGGMGLLLDGAGNDTYLADIFGQGGAYWYAAGMLFDYGGNDRYRCFEHCQGESLHIGGGFLVDLAGDDSYAAYEHAQGVGLDHAVGMLYESNGDDQYKAVRQSQGAGLQSSGVGILLDSRGADSYTSQSESQGYALNQDGAADREWPIGLLLDLAGEDGFAQAEFQLPDAEGRIVNRQGVAIDY